MHPLFHRQHTFIYSIDWGGDSGVFSVAKVNSGAASCGVVLVILGSQ